MKIETKDSQSDRYHNFGYVRQNSGVIGEDIWSCLELVGWSIDVLGIMWSMHTLVALNEFHRMTTRFAMLHWFVCRKKEGLTNKLRIAKTRILGCVIKLKMIDRELSVLGKLWSYWRIDWSGTRMSNKVPRCLH